MPHTGHILVVDDDPQVTLFVKTVLGTAYRVDVVHSGVEALHKAENIEYDAVLTDLVMPEMDGIDVLRRLRERDSDLPVIVLTGQASIETAVEAMRQGAFDYLSKGAGPSELRAAVERAVHHGRLAREVRRLRAEVEREWASGIVARTPKMRELLELARRVAQSDASVLIEGESGTGKELLARFIHRASPRGEGPFVAFDGSALAPTLVESELFGHVKGAFTGAHRARRGLFREAHGGTLFIDEIGDLALEIQTKLLRVLQEKEVRPVGGDDVISVDVRIVCATHRDLRNLVQEGRFREDLYYRLAVFPLKVPPLRERPEDIPELVTYFLSKRRGRRLQVAPDAMAMLMAYPWPGNVRELENIVERAAILCDADKIRREHLPPLENTSAGLGLGNRSSPIVLQSGVAKDEPPTHQRVGGEGTGEPAVVSVSVGRTALGRTLREIVADAVRTIEREAIRDALKRCDGSPARAARLLGISRATLYQKIKTLGIPL